MKGVRCSLLFLHRNSGKFIITEAGTSPRPHRRGDHDEPSHLPNGGGEKEGCRVGSLGSWLLRFMAGIELTPSLRPVLHLSESEADVENGAQVGHKEVLRPKPTSGFLPQRERANEETCGPLAVCLSLGVGSHPSKGGFSHGPLPRPGWLRTPPGGPLQVRNEEPQQVASTPQVSLLCEGKDLPKK